MRIVTLFILLVASMAAKAQALRVNDLRGVAMRSTTYVEVIGSPYSSEDWQMATLTDVKNNTFADVPVKLDQVRQVLLFKNGKESLEFVVPVTSFELKDPLTDKKAVFKRFPDAKPNKFFYAQVLSDGKVKLLKADRKSIGEERAFNSAKTDKVILSETSYLFATDGNAQPLKAEKSNVDVVFADHKSEVNAYIKKQKLSFKNEGDLIALVMYYNSL